MNKKNSCCCFTFPKWLWWLLSLLGLATLFYLMMNSKQALIENDIAQQTTQALESAGLNWAKPSLLNRGRDVLLNGTAPSEAAKQQALNVAQDVRGVRTVDDTIKLIDVAQPSTPTPKEESIDVLKSSSMKLEQAGDTIILTGALPSQQDIDSIFKTSQLVYGAENVSNQLQLSDKVAEPSWLSTILGLIPDLPKLDNHSLSADGAKLTIKGEARDNDTYQTFSDMLNSASKEAGLTANSDIKIVDISNTDVASSSKETTNTTSEATADMSPSVAPEITEEKNNCQQQLNTALADSTILFATNSATIRAESYPLLQQLGNTINQCKAVIGPRGIEIAGHTDSRGNDAYNLKLSEQRAESVMNYLRQNQVDSSLMQAKGYGESQPIASEDTAEGLAKNRRITFTIQ